MNDKQFSLLLEVFNRIAIALEEIGLQVHYIADATLKEK